MKKQIITSLLSIAALTVAANSTFAASNASSKPKCPQGQIAKFENGHWSCEDLTIKAPGKDHDTMSSTKPTLKKTTAKPSSPPKRSPIKKADLTIESITKVGGTSNKFGVKIVNKGQANSVAAQLFGTNTANNNNAVNAAENIPAIQAGEHKFVFITFNGTQFDRGDRIIFEADGLNQVNESNENNNKKAINYN
ncbi:hypothetical protein OAV62_01720 [bacterium]|nr:hypothetical protein [bacterium]